MKQGLNSLQTYAGNDPFPMGIPFQWCSNNLVVAAATQARLYRQITGDRQFEQLEATLTDWLFGCNPWGTSMIVGLPTTGDYPSDPHSAITYRLKQPTADLWMVLCSHKSSSHCLESRYTGLILMHPFRMARLFIMTTTAIIRPMNRPWMEQLA